jgi:hypothetical protein
MTHSQAEQDFVDTSLVSVYKNNNQLIRVRTVHVGSRDVTTAFHFISERVVLSLEQTPVSTMAEQQLINTMHISTPPPHPQILYFIIAVPLKGWGGGREV